MKRLLACFTLFAAPAFAADEPPSIETFFKPAQYTLMTISPDGEHIAALAPVNGKQNIVLLSASGKRTATPVTGLNAKDVIWVQWLNSKRLVFQTGTRAARVEDSRGGGLFAIDRDSSNSRQLAEGGDERMLPGVPAGAFHGLSFVRRLPGEGDDFIAQEHVYESKGDFAGPLVRLDSRTARRTVLDIGKPDSARAEAWVVDNKGVGRVFTSVAGTTEKIYYRSGPDAPWRQLDELNTIAEGQWSPLAVADDDRTLIVSSWRGRDKAAVMRYDPETKAFGEVLAAHPQVDLIDLARDAEAVRGVRYRADRGGAAWFDEDLAKVQAAMDKAFPDTVNELDWSRDRQRFIVTTHSDVFPGSFYLFDKKTGRMEWLADRAPWIDAKKMSPMRAVRYKARDGLEIPAYLTIPKNSDGRNLPMVVMVHGGPWVEGDEWRYHPEVQFLASRGYAVLQPNFRGTMGYGWKHYASSFKQWGLAMQDDVADGVLWAEKEGIADPKRVCIYGASYGGYATMMGLAKTPELYKCGINYVGVTDLPLMLSATWSDFANSDFLRYTAKETLGDTSRDAERLKNTSPVELASRIRSPVLMAYGGADDRVPIEHGTRMKAALERAGQKPQWIVADGEGHGFRDIKNQVIFYGAMEKFLAENIGK